MPNYGNRPDGTPKGMGFFGELPRPDGGVSTELTIGVNVGGKEMEIPSLVPGLTPEEINHLLEGRPPTPEIVRKAITHSLMRQQKGQSPFAGDKEMGPFPPPGLGR